MNNRDSLGDRMKRYENVSRIYLTPRSNLIIRCDGKAFHSYKFEKPFDNRMIESMKLAAQRTAVQMQGFKLGYVQSDEVSFLLTDYDTLQTQGWFDYNLQKIVSISASLMSTNFFNEAIKNYPNLLMQMKVAEKNRLPIFDSRAFIIPDSDVANYFLWRAKDWERNSIQMYAQSCFSHKQLMNKNREDMHNMLHSVGKNWTTDLKDIEKNGTFFTKEKTMSDVLPNYESVSAVVDYSILNIQKEK